MPVLNISHPQIRPLDKHTFVLFAESKTALNFSYAFQADEFPALGNAFHPRVAGGFQHDVLREAARYGTLYDGFAQGVESFELASFGDRGRINRRTTRIQMRRDQVLLTTTRGQRQNNATEF